MRKIIFSLAFIFAVIFQSVSSAADLNSVDWSKAPKFSSKTDFVNYLRQCENNCQSSIPVVFTNGVFVDANELINYVKNTRYANVTWYNDSNGRPSKVLYELNIYPGARVAYAYRTGNTSILTNEERKLYNVAVNIVKAANAEPTFLRKELYLHEKIIETSTYYNTNSKSKTPRHCTAVGALIDGRANCQGYADAFYMLGTMCGMKIGKITGVANNGEHVWNTIEFSDGKIYCVDVTFDDASFTSSNSSEYGNYIYFNAPLEIMKSSHKWDRNYAPNIQPKIDGRYFYFTQEFIDTNGLYFGFHSKSAEDALNYIAQRAIQGHRLSWGAAPYDSRYANLNFSLNRLVKEILPQRYNFYGYAKMSAVHRGNWIFYTADVVRNN